MASATGAAGDRIPDTLFYNFNSSRGQIIHPKQLWSVRDIKEEVQKREQVSADSLRVIYRVRQEHLSKSGFILEKDVLYVGSGARRQQATEGEVHIFLVGMVVSYLDLQDCDIQSLSTVHVLQSTKKPVSGTGAVGKDNMQIT